MTGVLLPVSTVAAALAAAPFVLPALDRADTEVFASVAPDLASIRLRVRTRYEPASATDLVHVVLAADTFAAVPPELRASTARELYAGGVASGGFEVGSVRARAGADGAGLGPSLPCAEGARAPSGGARGIECPLPEPSRVVLVEVEAVLRVPERYGAFAVRRGQLTLGAGWYPLVSRPEGPPPRGPVRVELELPEGRGAVVGRRYYAPRPLPGARVISAFEEDAVSVPLVVLGPRAGATPADPEGRALIITRAGARDRDPARRSRTAAELLLATADALAFLREEGLPQPSPSEPWLVVEAPLRHELALATDGPVLASDRAFRMFPVDRFLRFHRFPLLRELFAAHAIRLLESRVAPGDAARVAIPATADLVAAWLVDRYVASRFGARENAFDVLSFWSFIPSIDSMLYAPDLPFVGAYFRLVDEHDPLTPNLLDFPSRWPRGKVIYEKLVDRAGAEAAARAALALLEGTPLPEALALGAGAEGSDALLSTWLRPYPDVRYALGRYGSVEAPAAECGGRAPCFRAEIEVVRDGEAVAEPVEVLVTAEDGAERLVRSAATAAPVRSVTATLAAALDEVRLDPRGRLAERPSREVPEPRFDNASSPRWKLLLNNFNVQLLASEGAIDTALDLGIARVHDVRWSYGIRADYDPATAALSARATYGFGEPVTAARLDRWVGLILEGAYLRPGFGVAGAAGAACSGLGGDETAFATSAAVVLGYDDRRSVWAPEAGTGLRVVLEYNRVFGELTECRDGAAARVSPDSVSASARFLRQWRLGGAHQISVRAKAGAFLVGSPREQLLFRLGGRTNVRAYTSGAAQGRAQGIASAEWLHPLLPELDENAGEIAWVTGIDGALFADVALLADGLEALDRGSAFAGVGYGVRLYLDYFGVRPGVMAVDVAVPLVGLDGRPAVGPPAIYVDFSQSFLAF